MAARVIAVVLALLGTLIALGASVTLVRLILIIRELGLELSTTIKVVSWHMSMSWFIVLCAAVLLVGLGLIGGAVWFWSMSGHRDGVSRSSP